MIVGNFLPYAPSLLSVLLSDGHLLHSFVIFQQENFQSFVFLFMLATHLSLSLSLARHLYLFLFLSYSLSVCLCHFLSLVLSVTPPVSHSPCLSDCLSVCLPLFLPGAMVFAEFRVEITFCSQSGAPLRTAQ